MYVSQTTEDYGHASGPLIAVHHKQTRVQLKDKGLAALTQDKRLKSNFKDKRD